MRRFPAATLPLILGSMLLGAITAHAADAERMLRAELAKGLTRGLPSISLAIATRQGVIWEGAVGYADLPSRSRAHPAYLYGIGSITKMFAACVIEQLIDEGRLSLDAKGRDLLGEEVIAGIPNADRATVRQLLEHTSGVPSWEFDSDWIRHGRGADMDIAHQWGKTEALDYLKSGRDRATNEPGLGYAYSNSNYTLLGLIIEKVTGHEAVAEIHDRLLRPLGLTDTYVEGFETVDRSRIPSRYHFGTRTFVRNAGMHPTFRRLHGPLVRAPLIDVSRSNLSTEWLAGAMVATARDLALFARALRDGRVVSPAGLARMSAFRPTDDKDEDMGQGLALDRYGRERMIGYTGNVLGFGAVVGWVPDGDLVLAVMTNVGVMHAGERVYYPEKLLKETRLIAAARALARTLAPHFEVARLSSASGVSMKAYPRQSESRY